MKNEKLRADIKRELNRPTSMRKLAELLNRCYAALGELDTSMLPAEARAGLAIQRNEIDRLKQQLRTEGDRIAELNAKLGEQQSVAEEWWQVIHDTLRNYSMTTLVDEEGYGYPLIDAMTADSQTVSGGIEECTYLADAIWNALLATYPAAMHGDIEITKLISCVRYLTGIAERGLKRQIREDESVESFVLKYVQSLEAKPSDDVAKDAARYRLLRCRTTTERIDLISHVYDTDMDNHIDAAMGSNGNE